MKYFAALPIVAGLAAAQGDMQVMSLAPEQPAGQMIHTVGIRRPGSLEPRLTAIGRCWWYEARRYRNGSFATLQPRVHHRSRWRYGTICLHAKEPHRHSINIRRPLPKDG